MTLIKSHKSIAISVAEGSGGQRIDMFVYTDGTIDHEKVYADIDTREFCSFVSSVYLKYSNDDFIPEVKKFYNNVFIMSYASIYNEDFMLKVYDTIKDVSYTLLINIRDFLALYDHINWVVARLNNKEVADD